MSWGSLLLRYSFLLLGLGACERAAREQPAARRLPAVTTPVRATDTVASVSHRELPALLRLLEQDSLVSYSRVRDLPPVVASFLAARTHGAQMADVGAPFEATDAIGDGNLPTRQLVYLGVGKQLVLLSYYVGGFGLRQRVALFQLRGTTLQTAWSGSVTGKPTTQAELRLQLQQHQQTLSLSREEVFF